MKIKKLQVVIAVPKNLPSYMRKRISKCIWKVKIISNKVPNIDSKSYL